MSRQPMGTVQQASERRRTFRVCQHSRMICCLLAGNQGLDSKTKELASQLCLLSAPQYSLFCTGGVLYRPQFN